MDVALVNMFEYMSTGRAILRIGFDRTSHLEHGVQKAGGGDNNHGALLYMKAVWREQDMLVSTP